MLADIVTQLLDQLQKTHWLEVIAVFFGIASVLYSRKEHVWVYPTGLVNTILYTYLNVAWWGLYAEASLNFYYTVMSIYGWYLWSRKDQVSGTHALKMSTSTKNQWIGAVTFFFVCWLVLYFILSKWTNSTVPVADSFASASAYTAMWLMAKKKLENWIWWIVTNTASIPLYFYKGAPLTSFQYLVFLILAFSGFITWRRKLKHGA